MRPILAAVVVCVCVPASGACGLILKDPFASVASDVKPVATLSREQAAADLDDLFGKIERIHPAPYRFQSREAVDGERRRLIDTMPASITPLEFCLRASRLMAAIDEGHTSVRCERLIVQQWRRAAMASAPETQTLRMFPPFMLLDDQQHLIIQWPMFVPGLESGDRLLRINGQDADALLMTWAREVSHDTEAGRLAHVTRTYRQQLALHGIDAPYRLEVAAPGEKPRELVTEGDPVNYHFSDWPRSTAAPAPSAAPAAGATGRAADIIPPEKPQELKTAFFNYRLVSPGIGYMDFFSLFDGLDSAAHFRTAVDELFVRVESDWPHVLIIDVRSNGGGHDAAAVALLRHITEKPFRLLASSQIRRSTEARDAFKAYIRIPFRWMGLQYLSSDSREYFTGAVGSLAPPDDRPLRSWPRAEPFFDGPVCVLTGPLTFSAAAEFADAIKTYELATLVGEETGGRPNDFGNNLPFALPHSGLVVNIATMSGVRANGDGADRMPVIPDILVRRTAADIKSGHDPVLERAKSCPARSVK